MPSVPVTELLGDLLLVAFAALLGGAALAAAFRSPLRRRGHARELERFAAGNTRRDPNSYPIGPHKSFADNFRRIAMGIAGFGVVFVLLTTAFGAP